MNTKIFPTVDPGLLTEMLNYFPYSEVKFKTEKAARVYFKCLRAGKFKLAAKIEYQYSKGIRSDRIISLEMLILAQSVVKEETHICNENEVMRQGDGYVYGVCKICGKELY